MSEINHTLETGTELIDQNEDTRLIVEDVHDDGSITWVVEDDVQGEPTRVKLNDTRETVTEEEIVTALVDGIVATPDGKSHELVKSF